MYMLHLHMSETNWCIVYYVISTFFSCYLTPEFTLQFYWVKSTQQQSKPHILLFIYFTHTPWVGPVFCILISTRYISLSKENFFGHLKNWSDTQKPINSSTLKKYLRVLFSSSLPTSNINQGHKSLKATIIHFADNSFEYRILRCYVLYISGLITLTTEFFFFSNIRRLGGLQSNHQICFRDYF